MNIFDLMLSTYPDTFILFFWLTVFALGISGLLMVVETLNRNAETYGPQARTYRNETREFHSRLAAL